MRLLKSGRIPEARQATIVEMICKRGDATDLQYIYEQAVSDDGFSGETRLQALEALADAALQRKVQPAGDLSRLRDLIAPPDNSADPLGDSAVRLVAVRLAGIWQVDSLRPALQEIARDDQAPRRLREAALDALVRLGGAASREVFQQLAAKDQSHSTRVLAVAALAKLDLEAAADEAMAVLQDAGERDDLEPMLEAFLNRQGGADQLAAAVREAEPPEDVAKLALRGIYALGHSSPELVAALNEAANITADVKPLTPEQIQQLIAEVAKDGDAARGEEIFRRADVGCMKCHAVSGAGGSVGPDLSPIGSSSPVDYIINSIMVPDLAIKEEFQTMMVLTVDGDVFQGIVVDRDDQRLVLKEATGSERVVAVDDIEAEKKGSSLMPKGLVNFLTHRELVDLIRFVSELGKPGPYAVRSTPTIQRWRVLTHVPPEVSGQVPGAEQLRRHVLNTTEEAWAPAYAKVAGQLPLEDAAAETDSDAGVLYLQGELEVVSAGSIRVQLDSAEGVQLWLDETPMAADGSQSVSVSAGRHRLTARVDRSQRGSKQLRAVVQPGDGSPAEFTVVGGR